MTCDISRDVSPWLLMYNNMAAKTKYAPPDWLTSNSVIQSTAERQRNVTHDVRQQSNRARNETDITTRWTQHKTDSNLQHRIANIFDWKDSLAQTLADTEEEITCLMYAKRIAECAVEAKDMPLQTVLECLNIREGRAGIDNVRDDVESELYKEVEVITGIRTLLQQRISEAFDQICVLQACHQQLATDLSDKHSAIAIDSDCARLTDQSGSVSMQSDPTRIEKGIVTPEQWEAYSSYNVRQAENEMALSVRLREAINQTVQQTTNDLESQWIASNSALRKRVHELKQAKDELEWQKGNTEEEINKVTDEIEHLKEALENKHPPMMVAQTRLENRTYRPNVELCRDTPQYQLVEEVTEIASSQKNLGDKLKLAMLGLGTLERTLERINSDIGIKTNSLQLDKECLVVREVLSKHPKPQELDKMVDNQKDDN